MFKKITKLIFVLLLWMLLAPVAAVLADVFVYCLDTSASMNKNNRFRAAKAVLIQQVEQARPGDVVYVIAFDSNDYLLGRVQVGEEASDEKKTELIAKIRGHRAQGLYTNLDEPLQAAKALLLEERTPGARKIVVLSDGLSDPSPDHTKLDLNGMAEMIPQDLGWGVYLVGLPDDIAGLFQTQLEDAGGIVPAPGNPHIKGVSLDRFSKEKIEEAVKTVKEDPVEPVVPKEPEATAATEGQKAPRDLSPLLWLIAGLLFAVPGVYFLVPRNKGSTEADGLILEIKEGDKEVRRLSLPANGKWKKTVGPRGDIQVQDDELPPVVCTLSWQGSQHFLTPLDAITINNRSVTTKAAVGVGDLIGVRDRIKITILEGGNNP